MGTTVSLSDEAYRVLKSQKREGESFSDLILRKFGRGNPAAVLTYLSEKSPNLDLADSVEMAIEELRRGLKLERVEA
jgi:predicted CopG family antitoxin